MFLHIYQYRLKTIFRTKDELFWILLFPLLLGSCFYAGFHNITEKVENFNIIPVAVVYENISDTDSTAHRITTDDNLNAMYTDPSLAFFNSFIEEISDGEDAIISVTYTDADTADELLSNGDITGIITFGGTLPSLTITKDGISQSILKEVIDTYIQSASIISSIAPDDSEKIGLVMSSLNNDTNYIIDRNFTNGNTDYMIDYYYSLIAMTCLFASFSGQSCAEGIKANLTAQGMRKCLSPVGRMTLILGDFFASCTFPVISNVILIIYLNYILKVNLGGNPFLIILTAIFGSIIGVCMGLLIGSITKLSAGVKNSISTAISLFSSFLSGLMVGGIKYEIEKSAALINRINPATIITDALYSLNIYDTYDRYISCIGSLAIISVIICILSYFMIRRESYASI